MKRLARHSGMGVPTAILMCAMLLIVSYGVTSAIIVSASLSRVASVREGNEILFKETTSHFINGGKDFAASDIEDTTFTWKVLFNDTKEDDIHALVAEQHDELRFYAVYNYATEDLLAFQSSHFYTTTVAGDTYLAGLIKYTPGGAA